MIETPQPKMHCQSELEEDLNYTGYLPDEILLKWFNDFYSSSKHLLTLYSIAVGLGAKKIVEIGFGRSTFVLAKAANQTQGKLFSCDVRDFSYLLNDDEKKIIDFTLGYSDSLWSKLDKEGIDFAFLDYFSDENCAFDFVKKELVKCISLMKQNGVVCIHDSIVNKYSLNSVLESLKIKRFGLHNFDLEYMSLPYNYGLALIRVKRKSKFGIIDDSFIKKDDSQ